MEAPRIPIALASLVLFSSTVLAAGNDLRFLLDAEYFVYRAGHHTASVVTGDWDEDGRPDVATANGGDKSLSIFINEGKFQLRHPWKIQISHTPIWLAARDMNADGHLDIVATGDATTIFLGDGVGGFTERARFSVPGDYLAVGDLNGDFSTDIAVAQRDTISLLLLSRLELDSIRYVPAGSITAIALGDFDEDHDLDLTASHSPGFAVWLNNGGADFPLKTVYLENDDDMTSVTVGDVDGDAHLDIGVTSPREEIGGIRIAPGRGDGTFGSPVWAPLSAELRIQETGIAKSVGVSSESLRENKPAHFPTRPHFIYFADLNRDHRDEVIVLNTERGYEVGGRRSIDDPNSVVTADMDGDGILDLVASALDVIAIHPGVSDGSIRSRVGFRLIEWEGAVSVDLDGNGVDDVALDDGIALMTGGKGGVASVIYAPWHDLPVFADVNGDNKVDALSRYGELFPGRGDGSFEPSHLRYVDSTLTALSPGDIDHDGNVDLAVVIWRGGSRGPYGRSDPVEILFGNGDGSFRRGGGIGLTGDALELIDLDHDGHLDIVAPSYPGVRVAYGDGLGNFGGTVSLPYSSSYLSIPEYGDLDGDGLVDLFVADCCDNFLVFRNLGRAFQRIATTLRLGGAVGDLNADGLADLVSGSYGSLEVWLGNGDGSFVHQGLYGPGGRVPFGDRNNDGLEDLVVMGTYDADWSESTASVILNRSQRRVLASVSGETAKQGLQLAVGPNPSTESVQIQFNLPGPGQAKVEIFDLGGRRIAVPFQGQAAAGRNSVSWRGLDVDGHRVSSNTYFVRVSAGNRTDARKLVWLDR
jgi:hypothetical protein